ncbi:MAG: orotidine-5'-phosphate decarboxylase [Anaerolineaceae bacterium]|nr:orotidine-5'-phosphate decarboxylase [Anaerolineaceae bacterium]
MKAIAKYRRRARRVNSLLCLGLDSRTGRLPSRFLRNEHPLFSFNQHILQCTLESICAVKPNIAFYEAAGAAGLRSLRLTMEWLRVTQPDLFTICDAKRGDIGSTSAAYARAIFDDLGFDAVTLSPWLGRDALEPFLERDDKACIILCRTSNPGAGEFQDLKAGGRPLWQHVARAVRERWNERNNCMLVMGATRPAELAQARLLAGDMPILVPGVGAQGGDIAAVVHAGLDSGGGGLLINAARSILYAADPGVAARTLRDDINRERERMIGPG